MYGPELYYKSAFILMVHKSSLMSFNNVSTHLRNTFHLHIENITDHKE